MDAVGPCLEGVDRNVPVTVEPAAARTPSALSPTSLPLRSGPPNSSGSSWNVGSLLPK